MTRTLYLLLCMGIVAVLAPEMRATTVVKLSLEDLAVQADLIVTGKCQSMKSEWMGRELVTLATFEIEDVLKGAPARRVTVRVPGGIDANRPVPVARIYPGAVRFFQNEEVFLFLGRGSDDYTVLGFSQGAFSIVEGPNGEKAVSQDLSDLRLSSGNRLERGSVNRASLEEFKQRVRAILNSRR